MTNAISETLSNNTDELLALIVTIATFASYYVNAGVPTEPLMIIIGYYFGKKIVKV